MIRFLTLPLILVSCWASLHGQSVEWLTPTSHDFGTIEHDVEVSYAFAFRNLTDEPMLIHNVRTTCGCTASDYSLDPIMPDSTGSITISYDAFKKGHHKAMIKVYVSGQRKAEKLYIEAVAEK